MNAAERKVQFSEVTELAAKAWDAVRGDDPPFDTCAREFKDKLAHTAEAISKTGEGGAVGLEAFEAEVKRLLSEPEPPLDSLTVARLNDLAKERGVEVKSGARKAELVEALSADGND